MSTRVLTSRARHHGCQITFQSSGIHVNMWMFMLTCADGQVISCVSCRHTCLYISEGSLWVITRHFISCLHVNTGLLLRVWAGNQWLFWGLHPLKSSTLYPLALQKHPSNVFFYPGFHQLIVPLNRRGSSWYTQILLWKAHSGHCCCETNIIKMQFR